MYYMFNIFCDCDCCDQKAKGNPTYSQYVTSKKRIGKEAYPISFGSSFLRIYEYILYQFKM